MSINPYKHIPGLYEIPMPVAPKRKPPSSSKSESETKIKEKVREDLPQTVGGPPSGGSVASRTAALMRGFNTNDKGEPKRQAQGKPSSTPKVRTQPSPPQHEDWYCLDLRGIVVEFHILSDDRIHASLEPPCQWVMSNLAPQRQCALHGAERSALWRQSRCIILPDPVCIVAAAFRVPVHARSQHGYEDKHAFFVAV